MFLQNFISCVQQFTSYHAHREKNFDENNTAHHYRTDINNSRVTLENNWVDVSE